MSNQDQEQQFNILPHPAKSNQPTETADDIEQRHGGLGGAPNLAHLQQAAQDATGGKGPHIPSQEIANSLEQPKTREELQAEAKKLNE
ncbi:hypothetical protein BCR35DRAFT_301844 [Leucosporidium creatinivorum]|uniref:Uncharacterized protein n=1 Tax=Leucosporidium creatinivorum TaxID=106004 RepID=A0A1Y2FWF6_9BASI|nr:hypothetical protein BCR35DRAFT_301844 [Leucosporidium creatinivorum]